MKTPRDFLLDRHQPVEAKLDALRRQVLRAELDGAPRSAPAPWPVVWWQQLVRPCRGVWVGLAAAWVVIVALQALSGGPAPAREVRHASAPPPEIMALLQEQRRLRVELLGPAPLEQAATPARSWPPRSDATPLRGSACRRIEVALA